MRYSVSLAAITVVCWLGACSQSHDPTYHKTDLSGVYLSTEALDPNKSVIVSVSRDGIYHNNYYAGSGREVALKTAAAFSRFARKVEVAGAELQGREELLRAARGANAGYLIIPSIVHWEPRVTEWALIPAQVDVSLSVINVETGHEIRATLLEARSSKSATATSSLDSMYSGLLDDHVAELYGARAPISQR